MQEKGQIIHFSPTTGYTFITFPSECLATPCFLSHPMVSRSPLFSQGQPSAWSLLEGFEVKTCVCSKFPGHQPRLQQFFSSSVCLKLLWQSLLSDQKGAIQSWVWGLWLRQVSMFRVTQVWSWWVGGWVGAARPGGWKGLVGACGQDCRWEPLAS